MMTPDEVKGMIEKSLPDARVEVADQTGTMDHFQISVSSRLFSGKSRIDQHRMVQQALSEALADGRIHAVQIKTALPSASTGD